MNIEDLSKESIETYYKGKFDKDLIVSVETIPVPENIKLSSESSLIINDGRTIVCYDSGLIGVFNYKSLLTNNSEYYELKPINKSEIEAGDLIVGVNDKKHINDLDFWYIVDEDLNFNWINNEKPIQIFIEISNFNFYYKVVSK